MKQQHLMRHLRRHGRIVERNVGPHTRVVNPSNGRASSGPRHREIRAHFARAICQQLGVPPPRGR